MLKIKKHIVIPVFVPHKGCPFDCIFCNQKLISGQNHEASDQEIHQSIEDYLKTSSDAFVEIGFYGGSFTGIPIEEQKRYLEIGYSYVKAGKVAQLRLSTRPDYITDEILELLSQYHVQTIELGAQSMDTQVLKTSNRGHVPEDVVKASKLIKERGFLLGIQTMIGLPGDSREKAISTAKTVVSLKPDVVRIYPTLVVRGTYLQKLFEQGKYKPLSIDQAVDLCAELLELYEADNINVIRIGLQPTDNINESGDVIAGPFHPAFRQLVMARMTLDRMIRQIESKELDSSDSIIIQCRPKDVSDVIGQKRGNISFLKHKYGFRNILVKPEEKTGFLTILNDLHIKNN